MNSRLKQIGSRLPVVGQFVRKYNALAAQNQELYTKLHKYSTPYAPGHYHSPIPDTELVRKHAEALFTIPCQLPGIDLHATEQLARFESFVPYYQTLPFRADRQPDLRYFFDNHSYSYSDGICTYAMLRMAQPRRVIEAGSGYSSAVMLDTAERFIDHPVNFTFIDPNTTRLKSLMRAEDETKSQVIQGLLQDVPLERFKELQANDILFIDSTHISKIGSDVNYLFFEILPVLERGVYVHIHDILYPFEYHKEWVYEGRAWNEAYMLRAFLEFNVQFEIVLFNTYMQHFYRDWFQAHMPLCLINTGGSIWLRRV